MNPHETFHFQSLDQLRQRIQELGLTLDVADDPGSLLEPVRVDGRRLPTRLVILPMEGCDGWEDGSPDEMTHRRYRRFAAGGAGLLWFEATSVVEEERATGSQRCRST